MEFWEKQCLRAYFGKKFMPKSKWYKLNIIHVAFVDQIVLGIIQ